MSTNKVAKKRDSSPAPWQLSLQEQEQGHTLGLGGLATQDDRPVLLSTQSDFIQETGLAHPGFSRHQHHTSTPAFGGLIVVHDHCQLSLSSNEGSRWCKRSY